jgi:hypothetical protein
MSAKSASRRGAPREVGCLPFEQETNRGWSRRSRPDLAFCHGCPLPKRVGYKRNGTTTLFAALNMLDGTVIGECMPATETTRTRIRRGVFESVDELKQAIIDYLDKHNDQPKLNVWDNSSTAGTGSRSPAPASRACSPSTSHPSVQTSPTSAPPLLRSGLAQATQRWLAAFKSKKGVCR